MKRILITGSRDLGNREIVYDAIESEAEGETRFTVVHGANLNGADYFAHIYCQEHSEKAVEEAYPADWNKYGESAGPLRNQKMVDQGADICLAFPTEKSVGTWDCVRKADAAGINVRVIYERRPSLKDEARTGKQAALELEHKVEDRGRQNAFQKERKGIR